MDADQCSADSHELLEVTVNMAELVQSITFRSGKRSIPARGAHSGQGLAGLQYLSQLASDLSRGPVDLPCFPNVVIKIRDALNNPKTSIENTVNLVRTEPRLAAKLLQTANSAAFNPSGSRVTKLRMAITRLGQQLVQSAAMAFAVQQMKEGPKLSSIAKPLVALWKESIAVACISQVVARRTKIKSDEAFLTGLLHGMGRLYIMARSVGESAALGKELQCADLIASWHPSIGKAVLENWRVGDALAEAVGQQADYDRGPRHPADLTDVLIVSILLARALQSDASQIIEMDGVDSFKNIGLTIEDCAMIIKHAQNQLGSLHDVLGC
jgi:HD-like signal output (HDOD) protein